MKLKNKFYLILYITMILNYSCTPPKHETKYIYDYGINKTYNYQLEINGEGILSYFLISLSGKIKITSEISISVSEYKNRKLYTVNISNIQIDSSFIENTDITSIIYTNITVLFYMDEKGNKEIFENNLLYKFILDLIIPPLPENNITNEISFKAFNIPIGDTIARNEVTSTIKLKPETYKDFSFEIMNEITSLELENKDITLANIKTLGVGNVKNYMLYEYSFNLDSKTMIPLYKGSSTRVIGFKGKALVKIRMKDNVL